MTRFQKVLCPVDFSPSSHRAFAYALRLATDYGARVRVLHVISRIVPSLSKEPVRSSPLTAGMEKAAKAEFEKLGAKARKAGVSIDTGIRIGDVDLQILGEAREMKADLVVMGAHGHRGLQRWMVGSVAERLLRHSPIPLFTVGVSGKGLSAASVKNILVTTDFSAGTNDALDWASSLAQNGRARVTLLHVLPDPTPAAASSARKKLEGLAKTLRASCEVATSLEAGEPYKVILKAAKESKPGLVIMNTHGMGFVERVLIGSTAERVFRGIGSICPVLMVPPRSSKR